MVMAVVAVVVAVVAAVAVAVVVAVVAVHGVERQIPIAGVTGFVFSRPKLFRGFGRGSIVNIALST